MLEILKFIFSSFWIWLGFLIILIVIFGSLSEFFHITINKKDKDKKE